MGRGMDSEIRDFHTIVDQFLLQLDALKNTLPKLMVVSNGLLKRQVDKFTNTLEKYGTLEEGSENKYKIDLRHITKVIRAERSVENARIANDLIPRSFIITLVAQYDAYLGDLIKAILLSRPELQRNSERSITLSELGNFSSIDDARVYLVSKEIESLLRNSHSDQFEWMEKKFNVPLRKGLDSWPRFIELTERRNLFVHCNGKISEQYLAVCKRHGAELYKTDKIGASLEVTPDYVSQAYSCLYEIGVKLSQVLWRKLFPDQLEDADRSLINITYELLVAEEYSLAKELLFFATKTIKNHANEVNKLILTINLAIALKFSENDKACEQLLSSRDWSAFDSRFKLAVAVLRNDFDRAAQIMESIGPNGEISEREYDEWPLFKEFRKTDTFVEAYQKVFGKHFSERFEEMSIGHQ